jgi:hypothetical protein
VFLRGRQAASQAANFIKQFTNREAEISKMRQTKLDDLHPPTSRAPSLSPPSSSSRERLDTAKLKRLSPEVIDLEEDEKEEDEGTKAIRGLEAANEVLRKALSKKPDGGEAYTIQASLRRVNVYAIYLGVKGVSWGSGGSNDKQVVTSAPPFVRLDRREKLVHFGLIGASSDGDGGYFKTVMDCALAQGDSSAEETVRFDDIYEVFIGPCTKNEEFEDCHFLSVALKSTAQIEMKSISVGPGRMLDPSLSKNTEENPAKFITILLRKDEMQFLSNVLAASEICVTKINANSVKLRNDCTRAYLQRGVFSGKRMADRVEADARSRKKSRRIQNRRASTSGVAGANPEDRATYCIYPTDPDASNAISITKVRNCYLISHLRPTKSVPQRSVLTIAIHYSLLYPFCSLYTLYFYSTAIHAFFLLYLIISLYFPPSSFRSSDNIV